MGASWGSIGASWAVLEASEAGGILESQKQYFDKENLRFWCYTTDLVGVVAWSAVGGILVHLWNILESSWGILGNHRGISGHLGGIWGCLGGYLGVILGAFGRGTFETQLPSEPYRNVCTSAESLSGSWSAELLERPAAVGSHLVDSGVWG